MTTAITTTAPQSPVRVSFETAHGRFVAAIFVAEAPITAANFLRHVDEGRYCDAAFYRATRPDNEPRPRKLRILQGGLGPEYEDKPPFPPIQHEPTNLTGLSHVDGALAMARWAPGTAGSEFFFVLGDTPELDFGGLLNPDGQGFAVFGRVVEELETVYRINHLPTGTVSEVEFMRNQTLMPRVKVHIARETTKV